MNNKLYRDETEELLTDEIRKIEEDENVIWEHYAFPFTMSLDLDSIIYITEPSLFDRLIVSLNKATWESRVDYQGDDTLLETCFLEDLEIKIDKEALTATVKGVMTLGMREKDWKKLMVYDEGDALWLINKLHRRLKEMLDDLPEKQRMFVDTIYYQVEVTLADHEYELESARESYSDISISLRCQNCGETHEDSISSDGVDYLFLDNNAFTDVFYGEECHNEYDDTIYDNHEWSLHQAYASMDYLETEFGCQNCEKTIHTDLILERILDYFKPPTEGCEYFFRKRLPYHYTMSKKLTKEERRLLLKSRWLVFWDEDFPNFFKVAIPNLFKGIKKFFKGLWKWLKSSRNIIKEEMNND